MSQYEQTQIFTRRSTHPAATPAYHSLCDGCFRLFEVVECDVGKTQRISVVANNAAVEIQDRILRHAAHNENFDVHARFNDRVKTMLTIDDFKSRRNTQSLMRKKPLPARHLDGVTFDP